MLCSVFFFQAEDGIRDAQESRGLGDVYKRQPEYYVTQYRQFATYVKNYPGSPVRKIACGPSGGAVSYTHLTLPTIYSV